MSTTPDLVIRRRDSPHPFRLLVWVGWWDGLLVTWTELRPDTPAPMVMAEWVEDRGK